MGSDGSEKDPELGPRRRIEAGWGQHGVPIDTTFDPGRKRRIPLAIASVLLSAVAIAALVLVIQRASAHGRVRVYVEHGVERPAAPEVRIDGKLTCRSNPCDVKTSTGKHVFDARAGELSGSATFTVRRDYSDVLTVKIDAHGSPK